MLHPFQGGEQKPHSASTSSGSATVAAIYSGSSSPYRCRQRCTAVPVDNKSGLYRQCAGAGKPANEAKYVRRRRIADTACCTKPREFGGEIALWCINQNRAKMFYYA